MRTRTLLRLVTLCALAGAVTACAPRHRNLVVVIPDSNGHVGGVIVDDGQEQVALDTAGAGLRMGGKGRPLRAQMLAEEIDPLFAAALAAAPVPPSRYSLFFDEGTGLTPESEQKLPAILEDIRRRGASEPEVEVLGHTDRVGDDESNVTLSLARAASVRDRLVASGVLAEKIVAVGRGEVDPVVATEDEVAEPRNRRVEVTIR